MAQPGGEKITGFTRIMHRTTDDDLVVEVGGALGNREEGGGGLCKGQGDRTGQGKEGCRGEMQLRPLLPAACWRSCWVDHVSWCSVQMGPTL
jgi:hypothetical protein